MSEIIDILKRAIEEQDDDGLTRLYNSKEFNQIKLSKEMINFIKTETKKNNSHAENLLGYCYKYGIGVNKDYKLAFHYFKLSADGGNHHGENNLGYYYYQDGTGVNKDYELAFHYFKLSTDGGNHAGENNLGYYYQYGEGVEKDDKLAFHYYKLSADGGNHDGENNLGYCYKYGIGVNKDYELAFHYFKLSTNGGNYKGENNLNDLKKDLEFVNWLIVKNKELEQENLELKLMPPEKGGTEYENANYRFTNNKYE
jgi:TPR repeat protein